jgi:hypothetical protein
VQGHVAVLRERGLSWQDVYWLLWARSRDAKCRRCSQHFLLGQSRAVSRHHLVVVVVVVVVVVGWGPDTFAPAMVRSAGEMDGCRAHPEPARFSEGSAGGLYPCCEAPVSRFSLQGPPVGCQARDHAYDATAVGELAAAMLVNRRQWMLSLAWREVLQQEVRQEGQIGRPCAVCLLAWGRSG